MDGDTSGKKKFVKDIGIYAIGNLGSKLITFLLVPLYTHFIKDTAAFGYYDISLVSIFFLMPFVSFQLRDGSFRFLIDATDPEARSKIVTFVYTTLIRNSIVTILLSGLLCMAWDIPCLPYIVLLLLAMSAYEVFIQVVRGLGYTKEFVGAGILTSFMLGLMSLLFIVWLRMGIEGIFLANILARVLTIILIETKLSIYRRYFHRKADFKRIGKEILRFSLPLVLITIITNILTLNNRFFIEHYLGLADNGQFAVASKFASILETLAFIFYQAWQENALKRHREAGVENFYTSVFNNYLYFLCGLVIIFPFAVRLLYPWLVGAEYQSSAEYVYLMAACEMMFSICCFFDLGYQCSKNTMRNIPGVLLAMTVSLCGSYLLIKPLGIYGVIISKGVALALLACIRAYETRSYLKIDFQRKGLLWLLFIAIGGYLYAIWNLISIIGMLAIATIYLSISPAELRSYVADKIGRKPGKK